MNIARIAVVVLALPITGFAQPKVNFNRDVRPILSDRCFQCHGPNEHDRQADLRLDRSDGTDGAHRTIDGTQAIKPGSIEDSALWQRITSDGEDVMPPPDSNKKPLTDAEKTTIRRWIEQGAEYVDFWSFVPPRVPQYPDVRDDRWNQHPIDRLVMHRLEEEGLQPKPTVDRRTLIRRLSLDLTGLPPTRNEIAEFLADESADAYERLVDHLLAKPQYGEHMAKYWLDLVRFADTNGIHHDHYRDLTPYRDWVIRAFNQNLHYDDFVKFQLAGDLYSEPTRDQLIASGFHRLHLIIDRGTALPEESFNRNVLDRVESVGTAFFGLTVQCAVCHDHKYDPVTMKDFYQLSAFFNNIDAEPETGGREGTDFKRGLQPPYINITTAEQDAKLAEFTARIDDLNAQIAKLKQRTANQAANSSQAEADLKAAESELQAARDAQEEFLMTVPAAMVMKERAEPRPAYILIRGQYDKPGQQVERNTPAFLPPMSASGENKSRMDLAEWFLSPNHPLTARVAVNRFWQQLFGVGIVKTSEDFGAQGSWPSHPELLDHLAVWFVESGWDVKALMKHVVMSETYRQSSSATPEEFQRDAENRLLARGSRFRLDSEVIRDQILATSGLLNHELFGKSVKPPQPAGLWEQVSMPSSYPRSYEADTGDRIYRRSVYTFWKRGMPPPQMTILNAPTREACTARRERTNTPLQALLLMNEPQFLNAARHLAWSTLQDGSASDEEQLNLIYETITSKLPGANQSQRLLKMVADLEDIYADHPELADQLCDGVELSDDLSKARLSAWTMLVSSIYNLDITKTRQ
ncbi:MAG: DUF1553 domain-containing protein [Planctomycetaceae bacterium]